jgi:hypothetical protein
MPGDAVTEDWLDAQIAEAEAAAESAGEDRAQASRQRVADLTALKQAI